MRIHDEQTLNKAIGIQIRTYRRIQNITQRQLEEALGMTEATLSRYESGQRTFSVALLWRIAVILQVPVTMLVPPIATSAYDVPLEAIPVIETNHSGPTDTSMIMPEGR